MPRLDAIDLSHWNDVTSWDELGQGTALGVIHKATEGVSYTDPDYPGRKDAAASSGLLWAAYHFLKHGNAIAQMNFFLQVADLPPGSRVVIDYEDEDCTLADLREAVVTLQELDPSMQICIYGGHLLKQQLGDDRDELLAQTSLWVAQYTSAAAPEWPTGTWPVWTLWQYTDGQQGGTPREVPGAKPPIDCNTFNGSREGCVRWFGPVSDEPVLVEKELVEKVVEREPLTPAIVTLHVKPGTVVIINGVEIVAP